MKNLLKTGEFILDHLIGIPLFIIYLIGLLIIQGFKKLIPICLILLLTSCSLNRVSMKEYYLHKQGICSGSEFKGHKPFLKPIKITVIK